MKDRLLKFLNNEQLSSARFAEIIGVQPSGVSHVLSGRNNPGFDFIRKTLINFPLLNAEWLIMGKGKMFKETEIQGDLFSGIPEDDSGPVSVDTARNREQDVPDDISGSQDEKYNNSDTYVNSEGGNNDYNSELNKNRGYTNVNNGKFIEKIVILYSDKSFSEYTPS